MIRLLIVLGLCLPLLGTAAPTLSARLGPTLGQLRTLTDAKDFKGALDLLHPALQDTKPTSYDRFILLQIQGRIYISENQLPSALSALESAYTLGQAEAYFDDDSQPELLHTLAQLQYQTALNQADSARKAQGLRRALDFTQRWLALVPEPDATAWYFIASLRFSLATAEGEPADRELLRTALADTQQGLQIDTSPPRQLRLLAIAILQQLGRNADTIPYLELLVSQQPDDTTLWQQLVGTYLTLASQTPDQPGLSRPYYLRAILTLERAAENGRLIDSQNRLQLVQSYLQVEGYQQARQLLASGLRSGEIESTPRTWQFLAALEQEHGTTESSLVILREAAQHFPDNDGITLELARRFQSAGRTKDAYTLALAVVQAPERLTYPGRTFTFLAYLAYELGDQPAALQHLDSAATFNDARADDLQRLRAVLKP